MLTASWHVLVQLAPWLLLGMVVAGLLHGLLPEGFIHRRLRGYPGVVKAVLLGVPLPLCSCGVIPAAIGLKRDGAGSGASLGFLISTPQTGMDAILVSGSLLGWPFAMFKVASAAITGLAGGFLAQKWEPADLRAPGSISLDGVAGARGFRSMVTHSLSILRSIWHWLVIGVLVSAAIEQYGSRLFLDDIGRWGSLPASLVTLLFALPLYVCATASVPIAAALVASGFPPGAALVFLMAGPATNAATVGAIYREFGAKNLAIYLGTIISGSMVAAGLFDMLLTTTVVTATDATGDHMSWWSLASAVLLLLLAVWFAVDDSRRVLRRWFSAREGPRRTIFVQGMRCGDCARRLEDALRHAKGVNHAEVHFDTKTAIVRGRIEDARIREVVQQTGFTPD